MQGQTPSILVQTPPHTTEQEKHPQPQPGGERLETAATCKQTGGRMYCTTPGSPARKGATEFCSSDRDYLCTYCFLLRPNPDSVLIPSTLRSNLKPKPYTLNPKPHRGKYRSYTLNPKSPPRIRGEYSATKYYSSRTHVPNLLEFPTTSGPLRI